MIADFGNLLKTGDMLSRVADKKPGWIPQLDTAEYGADGVKDGCVTNIVFPQLQLRR